MPITFIGGVISFNGRTGQIILLSSDVVTALGFTPENVANKAIDFTTVNNVKYPTVEAVVNYIGSLPGGGVTSFNTRTGAIVLLSADVIAALGYTPAPDSGSGSYIQNNTTVTPQNATIFLSNQIKTTASLLSALGGIFGNTLTSKGANTVSSLFNNTFIDPANGQTTLQSVVTVSAVASPLSNSQRAIHGYLNVASNNANNWVLGGSAVLAEAHLTPSSSAFTIPSIAAMEFSVTNNVNAPTLTNMYGLLGSGLGFSGSETNAAAIATVTPTGATNTTNLLLGTVAIPAGNHNIYTNSAWDSYLGTGTLTVGGLISTGTVSIGTIPALATPATNYITSDSGIISSRTIAQVQADLGISGSIFNNNQTSLTGNNTITYPAASLGTYRLGCYCIVNSGTGVYSIVINVSYTDVHGVVHSINQYGVLTNTSLVVGLPCINLRCLNATNINISTIVAGTVNYDIGVTVEYLAP